MSRADHLYPILFVAGVAVGCTTMGTDPTLVAPNVRLEVFATKAATKQPDPKVDISVDGSATPSTEEVKSAFDARDVAIRVTGAQPLKGLGKVELALSRGSPFLCSRPASGTGIETTPVISAPDEIKRPPATPPGGPQGVLILNFAPDDPTNPLVEFVSRIRCVAGYSPADEARIKLVAKTTNIAGKVTSTPVLILVPVAP